jgi:integrase
MAAMTRMPVARHPGVTRRTWLDPAGNRQERFDASYRGADRREHSKSFTKLGDADRWLRDQRSRIDRNDWADPEKGREHLETFYARWRAETAARGRLTERTLLAYDELWRNYIAPVLGRSRIASITRDDVEAVVTRAARVSPWRELDALKVTRRVLSAAVKAGAITRNPASGVETTRIHQDEPRTLEREELERLLDHVPDRYQALVLTAAYSGLRWSELAGLKVYRLDLPRNRIRVEETLVEAGHLMTGPPKTERSRRWVTLPQSVTFAIAEHLRLHPSSEYVFTSPNGGPLRRQNFMRRVWRPAVQRAGLEGFRFRNLRHSHATWALESGVSPVLVAFRLGHASTRMIEAHYASLLESMDEAIAESLEAPAGYLRDRQGSQSRSGSRHTS